MARTTPPKPRLPALVDTIQVAVDGAVFRAMLRHHEQNPARYHQDRPLLDRCPYDPHCPFTKGSTG